MAVPSKLSEISATAANNSPTGSESIGSGLDDYIRGYGAAIRAGIAYKGADIASAATPDLDAVAGSYHDITGSTTITGFVSASAGIRKTLQFDGVVKLIHSTQLPLVDGTDLMTAAGTVIEVISEGGGVWRQVSMLTSSVIPPGMIMPYAGTTSPPTGWLTCDGSAVSRTTYANLFAVVGTHYGVGDGSSTFNLPNLSGRVVAGKEASASALTTAVAGLDGATLGATGGSQALHEHTHTASANDASDWIKNETSFGFAGGGSVYNAGTPQTLTITVNNAGTGSSQNVQPTIILHYVIKY